MILLQSSPLLKDTLHLVSFNNNPRHTWPNLPKAMRLRSLAEVKDIVSALTNHLLFPELERPGDGNSTGPRKEMYYILFSILISIPPTENDKISISRLCDLVSRLHLPYGPDLNIRQPSRDIILRHGDGK